MKISIILILFLLIIVNIVNAAQQDVFILILKYDKGELSTLFLNVAKGYFHEQVSQPENAYRLEVVSFDNKILYAQKFDFQLEVIFAPLPEWFDEKGNQIYIPNESETKVTINSTTQDFVIPYFDDAKKINIYENSNELKLSIDVSQFSKYEIKPISIDNKATQNKKPTQSIAFAFGIIFVILLFAYLIVHRHRFYEKRFLR